MKETLKKVYYGMCRMTNTIVSLFTICLFSSISAAKSIQRLMIDGTRAGFVLGNGPSLKEILNNKSRLEEIIESDCVVVNNFANSELFTIIKPCYYVLLDPVFFDESIVESRDACKSVYKDLHKVYWGLTLFIPNGANVQFVRKCINNPHVNITNFNVTRIVGFSLFQNISFKLNLGIPSSRNVIIPALFLMINLGYKNIYLYGADFSWTKTLDVDDRNGKLFINDRHFYSNEDIIHYEKGGFLMWMESIAEMIRGVNVLADYAEYQDVKIINRTKGSFIDAFKYENPDTL